MAKKRPQGRPPKDPADKFVRLVIVVPPAVAARARSSRYGISGYFQRLAARRTAR